MLVKLDGGRVEHQQSKLVLLTKEEIHNSVNLNSSFLQGYSGVVKNKMQFRNFGGQEVQTEAETQSLQGKIFRDLFRNTDGSTQSHTPTSF